MWPPAALKASNMSSLSRGATTGSSVPWKSQTGVRPRARAYSAGRVADLLPAVGGIAPEDAAGGDGDGGPAVRIKAGQLPGAVSAEGEAGEIGAVGVAVELGGLLVEGGHGQGQHVGVGPVVVLRALGHDDDEGPALGVVADGFGKADLGLPHALGAALAAAVEEENDGPGLAVVAAPVFGQVDLEAVGGAVELDAAIEEAGLLGRLGGTFAGCRAGGAGRQNPTYGERKGTEASKAEHEQIQHPLYRVGWETDGRRRPAFPLVVRLIEARCSWRERGHLCPLRDWRRGWPSGPDNSSAGKREPGAEVSA